MNTKINLTRESITLSRDQYDLIKCEFCDDHIKKRFIEMKELFFKFFKNYIKIIKLIKNKDEVNLKKTIEEIGVSQKEFLLHKNLIEKLIVLRKSSKSIKNTSLNGIILEGLDDRERNQFFEELNMKKDLLKKFRKNILDLEMISNNIHDVLENVTMSNCMLNNN